MTGNRPVYRYPPKSHAYNCPCDRCVQCRNRRSNTGSGGFWLVVLLMVLYGLPAGIWHRGTGFVIAAAIWWPALTGIVILALIGSRRQKHPKAPVPAAPVPESLPSPPQPVAAIPPCRHLNAVRVENLLNPDAAPWAWLCPECNEELPAEFGRLRRPCCGTEHGRRHLGTCPHFGERLDITGQWQP